MDPATLLALSDRPLRRDLRRLPRLSLAAVLALVAVGCSREVGSRDTGSEPAPLTALAVAAGSDSTAPGFQTHLYAEHDADVYMQLALDNESSSLVVESIRAETGDHVKKGQLLAVLDASDARLAVQSAEPTARETEAEYDRAKQLRQTGAVTEAEYEQAMYAYQRAAAALEQAKLRLERTRIRAPFGGVVSRRYVRLGQRVTEGEPLFRVTALSPLRARVLVPEESVADFRPGSPVRIVGVTGRKGEGKVFRVSPAVDPGSGTVTVIVELADSQGFPPGAAVGVLPPTLTTAGR